MVHGTVTTAVMKKLGHSGQQRVPCCNATTRARARHAWSVVHDPLWWTTLDSKGSSQ